MKLIHLPNGRWCMELAGKRSPVYGYESIGYWTVGPYLFVGQTEYYEEEKIICAVHPVVFPHESLDHTLK